MIKLTPMQQRIADQVAKRLIAEGQLVEAGFQTLLKFMPPNTTPSEIRLLRIAYYASADHIFSSVYRVVDETTEEPTEADIERMTQVYNELQGAQQMLWEFFNKGEF